VVTILYFKHLIFLELFSSETRPLFYFGLAFKGNPRLREYHMLVSDYTLHNRAHVAVVR
jgi:hypothetical protein